MKKSNFEKWTADEMRMIRREFINNHIHSSLFRLQDIKHSVRRQEIRIFGLELKRYYYYEYQH